MIKHFRSYEVSIWTLQDSFITVLKPSNLEPKGQIQNPIMNIKDDGENSLSFKIPMYLHENNAFKENPIWYNTRNGTIIAGMRKIKVIYNKGIKDVEKVFEFLITDVKEEHEGFSRYCSVTCEGLAFHELGKQGYRISLEGADEILAAQQEWADSGKTTRKPEARITYWCDRIFENSNWNYSVQMDWSGHDGIVNDYYQVGNNEYYGKDYSSMNNASRLVYNNQREEAHLRRRDTVYEDSFVSAWETKDDELIPKSVYTEREKFRLVEAKESNIYNLSQTIAELFQVFCRYEYKYDDNYHIIGREAIFYNNFLQEEKGVVDFTYYYNTSSLSREMDCSDLCSKMFVLPLNDADMLSGETTIMDTEANKSLEDYIFNFDYLYNIGTVNEEQYKAIGEYEKELRELNKQLIKALDNLYNYQNELVEIKAKRDNAEKMVTGAIEAQNDNNRLREQLIVDGTADENGLIETKQMLTLIEDSSTGGYYVNIRQLGVQGNTFRLFKSIDTTTNEFSNDDELFNFVRQYDDSGNLVKITHISKEVIPEGARTVYGSFKYSPKLYYDNIINTYRSVQATNEGIYKDAVAKVNILETNISNCESEYKTLLTKKQSIIKVFERLMGPALREGTWQPEDEYANYGDFYSEKGSLGQKISDILSLIWDSELFDDEQKNYYIYGVEAKKHYYPCIDLSTVIGSFANHSEYFSRLAFIYNDYLLDENGNPLSGYNGAPTYYFIGSKMFLHFIKVGEVIKPVLVITGMENLSQRQLQFILDSRSNARLSVVSINNNGEISDIPILTSLNWLITPEASYSEAGSLEITSVYPRFEINSDRVKSASTDILVRKVTNDNQVEKKYEIYEDYYVLYRDRKYFITLKPKVIFAAGTLTGLYNIDYTISEAALAVYLDAVKVLKENAYPKVSYNIDLYSVDNKFVYDSYNRLGQIAHINDPDLKFQNVMGYISELSLDLDKPQNDKAIIKNYKTKFEDLFSNIVAQTEEMKKNSYMFDVMSDAFNSSGNLSDDVFSNILERLPDDDSGVIDPATEYSKYEPYLRTELRQLFTQAGQIMIDAQDTIEDVGRLNLINSDILSSFAEDVSGALTPAIFIDDGEGNRIKEKDNSFGAHFKVGDIWYHNDNVYVATIDSKEVVYGFEESMLTSLKGWTLTQDGRLAAITGTSIDIDAKEGNIKLQAINKIEVLAKTKLDLVSNDLNIVGNNSVNIGSKWINIAGTNGGINIVNTNIDENSTNSSLANEISAIKLNKDELLIAAQAEVNIKSAKGINIYTSDNSTTSAISIKRNQGIYLGSNEPIKLYSGNAGVGGANVELTKDRILFGVSNVSGDTTAVKLTKDYMIFGAGNAVNVDSIQDTTIGSSVSGVYISKNAIKMATGDTSNRSYFSLDKDNLEFGVIENSQIPSGSYIKMTKEGKVVIGTAGEVVTDTNGFKTISNTTAKFEVYAPNFIVDSNGHLYANNATVAGTIKATSGKIGGWNINSTSISSGDGKVGLNSSFSDNNIMFWAGNNNPSLAAFAVKGNGHLYADNVNINGIINSASGNIGGWAIDENSIYTLGKEGVNYFALISHGLQLPEGISTNNTSYNIVSNNSVSVNSSTSLTLIPGEEIMMISGSKNDITNANFFVTNAGRLYSEEIYTSYVSLNSQTYIYNIGEIAYTVDSNYLISNYGYDSSDGNAATFITFSDGKTVNFINADRFGGLEISYSDEVILISVKNRQAKEIPNASERIILDLDEDYKRVRISYGDNISKYFDCSKIYSNGINKGREEGASSIEIGNLQLGEKVNNYNYKIDFNVNSNYIPSYNLSGNVNLSTLHTQWYTDGKYKGYSDAEAKFKPTSITENVKDSSISVLNAKKEVLLEDYVPNIYTDAFEEGKKQGWYAGRDACIIPTDYGDNDAVIVIYLPDSGIGSTKIISLRLEKGQEGNQNYVYCKRSNNKIARIKI